MDVGVGGNRLRETVHRARRDRTPISSSEST